MLGMPGAGKGTQSRKLSQEMEIPHISTGDMFREAVKSGSPLGIRAREIMTAGELVPDEIVLEIVKERLSRPDVSRGYILDGFPRTVSQARELDSFQAPDAVIYLALSQEEAARRLEGRRSCGKCGAQLNIYLQESAEDSCPKCGGELVRREDDTPETVRVRIETYIRQTKPLTEYYREKGLLREIDGARGIGSVFENIIRSVKK